MVLEIEKFEILRKETAWKLNLKPKDTFNFNCKFTRHYLHTNELRGLGKGLTPSSYIHRFYSQGNVYQWKKIVKDMEKNSSSSFEFLSKNNAIAYYPMSMFDEEKYNKWKVFLAVSILSPNNTIIGKSNIIFNKFRKTYLKEEEEKEHAERREEKKKKREWVGEKITIWGQKWKNEEKGGKGRRFPDALLEGMEEK